MTELPCNRCGLCCHYIDDAGEIKKCRYLIRSPNGKTLCRKYQNRLNTLIYVTKNGDKICCVNRELSNYDYVDCPNNTGLPMFPLKRLK